MAYKSPHQSPGSLLNSIITVIKQKCDSQLFHILSQFSLHRFDHCLNFDQGRIVGSFLFVQEILALTKLL